MEFCPVSYMSLNAPFWFKANISLDTTTQIGVFVKLKLTNRTRRPGSHRAEAGDHNHGYLLLAVIYCCLQ